MAPKMANELNFLLNITGQPGLAQTLRSGLLDLFPYRSLYLHPQRPQGRSLSNPRRCGTWLHRPVCAQQGATQVDFTFRDYRGQPIPMDGYVAIEIVFV